MHIISYNILAQAYLLPERYLGIPPEFLEAEARQSRLIQHIQKMDADMVCLQEVEPAFFEKLQAALPGLKGLYAPKIGRPDGLATFYKPSLTLTYQQVLHFENADPGYDHIAQILMFTAPSRMVDRSTAPNWGRLPRSETDGMPWHTESRSDVGRRLQGKQDDINQSGRRCKGPGSAFRLGNTHLRWQRNDTPESQHQGVLQLTELLDAMDALPDSPRVICGDLNANAGSPVIRRARERGLRPPPHEGRPGDTAIINGRFRRLDWVLFELRGMRGQERPLPSLKRVGHMPGAVEPSDHLPLHADLMWS